MDHDTPYMIGSNTKDGRVIQRPPPPPISRSSRPRGHTNKPKGRGFANVYIGHTLIKRMPISLIHRFSHVAAAAFPRDAPNDETDNVTPQANGDAGQAEHELHLHLTTLRLQPSATAFLAVFDWMERAQVTKGEHVRELIVRGPQNLNLELLVEIYAAALVLALRPYCTELRKQVMDRLTDERPILSIVQHAHNYLPMEDAIQLRCITSYYEHYENDEYTQAEIDEIDNYVFRVDYDFWAIFDRISESRARKATKGKTSKAPAKGKKKGKGVART